MTEQSKDRRYTYRGPQSGATLKTDSGESVNVMFFDGMEPIVKGEPVALPSEHPYVRRLVARGHLFEIVPSLPAAAAEPPTTPSSRPSRSRSSAPESV